MAMPLAPPPPTSTKRAVKASKLAKMSEQDRARYLEKRLAEEEESKKRKEEMINAFLRVRWCLGLVLSFSLFFFGQLQLVIPA